MEDIKGRGRDSESNKRKQLNIDSFNAVQHQMDKNTTNRKNEREDKNLEVQDRHVWEKEYKALLDDDKTTWKRKKHIESLF